MTKHLPEPKHLLTNWKSHVGKKTLKRAPTGDGVEELIFIAHFLKSKPTECSEQMVNF